MVDYYDILEIPNDSSEKQILSKLKELLKKKHPSKIGSKTLDNTKENFSKQLEALLFLRNSELRRKYDLLLKHKNNTEVRHSIKYKTFKEIVENSSFSYQNSSKKVAEMNSKEFKKHYREFYKNDFGSLYSFLGLFELIGNIFLAIISS